jgi:autotransporter translocation and assembly factor TamB
MLRRIIHNLALVLLALVFVGVPLALLIGGHTRWAREFVHPLIVRGMADYFRREVAVGPVTLDLPRSVTIEGLAVAEGARLQDGAAIMAERVRLDFDLWAILTGRLSSAAAVSRVNVWGLRVRAVLDPRGRLNLADIFPPPRKLPPYQRFRGRVWLHDAAFVLEDHSQHARLPAVVRVADVQGEADFSRVLRVTGTLRGRFLDNLGGPFSARIAADLEGPFLNLDLTASNLDVAWVYAHYAPPGEIGVTGGRVDLSGSLWALDYLGKKRQDFSFSAQLREVRGTYAKLPGPVVLNGTVWAGRNTVQAGRLVAQLAGSTYEVTGSGHDFAHPVLSVALTSNNASLGPLLAALPPEQRSQIAIPAGGYGMLAADIVGPADNPDLRLRVNMQGGVTLKLAEVGTIRAEGVDLTANFAGMKEPCVEGTVTARRLQAPALKLDARAGAWPHELVVGSLQGLKARVAFCGGQPMAQATITAPYLRADRLQVADLSTEAILAGDLLRLKNLKARALGGQVTAEASLWLNQPELGVRARGSVRGLNLARLTDLPIKVPEGLRGAVNADFQVHVTGKRFVGRAGFSGTQIATGEVTIGTVSGTVGVEGDGAVRGAGTISARDLTTHKLTLDEVAALVSVQGDQLHIASGHARGPDGILWTRGDYDLENKSFDLDVWAAELAMQPVTEYIGLERVSGTGYLQGKLTGTAEAVALNARLTMFEADVYDYAVTALTTDLGYVPGTLTLDNLLVSRGSTVIGGNLALGNLQAPAPQTTIRGHLESERMDLRELAQILKQDLKVTGLGEFSADLGGSLDAARLSGVINLANLEYEDFVAAQARVPFTLEGKKLTVSEGEALVLDAPVRFRGTVLLEETPVLDVRLSTGELRLEGLMPLFQADLPMAGEAEIREVWLQGPVDDLQGGGRLVASELLIGDENLRSVDATFALARGEVQLRETSFQIGGGRLLVSGAYRTDTQPRTITAQIKLSQTGLQDLLHLAVPIASALDKREAGERARLRLLLREYGLRLDGALEGDIILEGPLEAPTATVALHSENLVLDGDALPQMDLKAQVTQDRLSNVALNLRQGDALVTATGDLVFAGPIDMTVYGSGINMAQLSPWIPLDIPYGGKLGFTVEATGSSQEPNLMASIDVEDPSFAGVQFDVLSVPIATVTEGEIDVDTLIIKRQEREIVLDGQLPFSWHVPEERDGEMHHHVGLLPDGPVQMQGQIENTPVAFFLSVVDEYLRAKRAGAPASTKPPFLWTSVKTEGQVQGAVSVGGIMRNPTLTGSLKLERGLMQPPGWKTALSDVNMEVEFTGTGRDNWVQVKELGARYGGLQTNLTGRFSLNPAEPPAGGTPAPRGPGQPRRASFWENEFDLRLGVKASKYALSAGTELTDLDGAFIFRTENREQVLRAENLGFKLGGGAGQLTGEATLTNFGLADLARNQWDLHLTLDRARLALNPFLNARIGGHLDLVTPAGGQQALLQGTWTADEGVMALVAPPAGPAPFHALSSRYPSPTLDITVAIGRNLRMQGSGVTAPVEPNPAAAQISGTLQRPTVVGSVTSRHGTAILPTSTVRLNELHVTYALEPLPADRNDPVGLWLHGEVSGSGQATVARSGASSIRIFVEISGQLPDKVRITTTSDPPLSESQIYALLGGVPFAALPGVGGEASVGQVLSDQFLATLATAFRVRVFQPIEEELKRALGLSELGITFAFNQPVTLQVGKYVLENLLVSYEQPLLEGGGRYDIRVSYELPAGLRITYHTDERNINQFEIGYSSTF